MLEVMMHLEEKAMFRKYLDKATIYLEFGAGGSTVYAEGVESVKKGYSIESDLAWIEKVKGQLKYGKFEIIHGDIGPTKELGYPVDIVGQAELFKNYSVSVVPSDAVDLCLIDGRFRVKTCLEVLLRFPEATILFHDFTIRPQYKPVLAFSDIVEEVDTLVVLKRKVGVLDSDIESVIRKNLVNAG